MHRLTTLREAEQIYVFNKGQISDAGSFESLAERPGIFSNLLSSAAGPVSLLTDPALESVEATPVEPQQSFRGEASMPARC